MTEFVPRPTTGRLYSHERRVRLSDAGPDAGLRLDGVARYLQDAATDDWADSGLSPEGTWVVRRTALQVASGGRWPRLGETVAVGTARRRGASPAPRARVPRHVWGSRRWAAGVGTLANGARPDDGDDAALADPPG